MVCHNRNSRKALHYAVTKQATVIVSISAAIQNVCQSQIQRVTVVVETQQFTADESFVVTKSSTKITVIAPIAAVTLVMTRENLFAVIKKSLRREVRMMIVVVAINQ